jgi:mRNA interferase MazF
MMANHSDLKGLIVLVAFPFDDLSSANVRPALCLSDSIGLHGHVVVAFITSRVNSERLASDIVLTPDDADFAQTGLHVESTLRLHRLTTVTAAIIRRELGRLSASHMKQVDEKLTALFKLG